MANSIGRQVVAILTNKSGGSVALGDVVVLDSTTDESFTTTTSAANTSAIGVAAETIASNAAGRIIIGGYVSLVNVNASVTRNQFGTTHTVAKQATSSASRVAGTFCRWLKTSATPSAYIYPVDLAGTALTNPMTTAEDIIKGGVSGAPARVAVGAAGGALTVLNSAVAWNSGTSFPSAVTGDRYWRTDRGREYYYDGTRWLTTQELSLGGLNEDSAAPYPVASSPGTAMYSLVDEGENGAYITRIWAWTLVVATNNGSNFWTVQVRSKTAAGTIHNIGSTFDTSADTAGNRTRHTVTVNAVVTASDSNIEWLATKTGTPGSGLYLVGAIFYRLIG